MAAMHAERKQAFSTLSASPGMDSNRSSASSTREPRNGAWAERKHQEIDSMGLTRVCPSDTPPRPQTPHNQEVRIMPPESPAPRMDGTCSGAFSEYKSTPRRSLQSNASAGSSARTRSDKAKGSPKNMKRQDTVAGDKRHRASQLSQGGLARSDRVSVRFARWIVVNKWFIAITTILTVYALIGDDIRLIATNKPADIWFNIFTLTCLGVFSFEIVMSCLGKDDYIMGFFMALDVVSTITLILDLSYVSDIVMGDGEDIAQMRSGRTAKIGAKAGRVVRVIRLVRILKLYKAVYDALQVKRQQQTTEADEWAELEGQTAEEKMAAIAGLKESKVGKKLSEMTTRRVIILVLTMLLVLPFLRSDGADNNPPAAYYGADDVYSAYTEMLSRPSWQEGQMRYEKAILKYLYYHNWFTGTSGDCPGSADSYCSNSYYSHVFWVGLTSAVESNINSQVNSTRLRFSTVLDWNNQAASQDNQLYVFGTMPQEALTRIAGEWTGSCSDTDKGIFRLGFSVLAQEINNKVGYAAPCPGDLRNAERTKFFPRLVTPDKHSEWHFAFYFDNRPFTRSEALFGILITVFVCVVLCIASLYFSNDANKLVLRPVEHMIKRVETIRDNPLVAMRMSDDEFKAEEITRARAQLTRMQTFKTRFYTTMQDNIGFKCCCKAGVAEEPMETVVLEKTIIKLGSLLALGFGEAGANIIAQNLKSSDSAGVNVMIPGTKVECIVGQARIRAFTTATEVLQAKVMAFVNQVAEIVHGIVDEYAGAANKNNGDTFLLIWRTSGLDEDTYAKFADMSMMTVAKILSAIHRAPILAAYRTHPGLQQRLGTNCRVCLTFGLHAGWAIEGAVGSEFKIDASYLSPNVSIASGLELATQVYHVPILISQSVVEICNPQMAGKCRLIDRVLLRGSSKPMDLYSLDLDYECLRVDEPFQGIIWNSRQRFKARQFLEAEKGRKMMTEVNMANEFECCKDLAMMRRRFTIEFLQSFHMGYQNYAHGEWKVARKLLAETRSMIGVNDGPSQALLQFMEVPHNFTAPDGWKGIRELEDFCGSLT